MAAQRNQLGCDQGKVPLHQRLLSIGSHNCWRRADSKLSPTVENRDVTKRKIRECIKDVRYWILGGVVSGSAALASSPLPSDSKALRSESDIFATRARGSCGVDPGPVPLRIITFSASPMGDSLYGVRKRLVLSPSLMFSTVAMPHFTVSTFRGGGTDLALIRPR